MRVWANLAGCSYYMNAFWRVPELRISASVLEFVDIPSLWKSCNGMQPWVPCLLWMLSHEFLFPANESQTAFPWVPIPHSGCFSSSSCSMPVNLRMHSHEFLFDACESQNVLPWVQVPISLPMDSRLRLHSMSSYSHAKILESFGWVPPMSYHPDSGMPIESPRMRPERDFVYTPIHTTWVPLKSIVERFRCLYGRSLFCG